MMEHTGEKTLILIRHAKSSWNHPGLADHDRPLNSRGEHDAPMMGRRLTARGCKPDRIYSSTAARALSTAQAIAEELGAAADAIHADPDLYLASASELLGLIQHFDEAASCCLLVSHNPGITVLANRLANTHIENIPTAGIVELRLAVRSWSALDWGQARLIHFDYPKNNPGQ